MKNISEFQPNLIKLLIKGSRLYGVVIPSVAKNTGGGRSSPR